MYLKEIELVGFKSFSERTKIPLEPGISCVVGPNGSGKSNISDALRWVLGEQSARSLRGGKLEDVIFSGSKKRKALGMAEVSITLDNSDGHLNLPFAEIVITRRAFRSGQSEYLINNQNCRLKDIANLFLDTGIGVEGLSLIGQGQINNIISAKPDELRSFVEEAAGIVKFRNRKKDSLRKLRETQSHLERIGDIIFELESRLEPLEEQAKKAREFIILKDRRDKLDMGISLRVLNEADEKLSKINKAFKEANNLAIDGESSRLALEAEEEVLRRALSNLDTEVAALQEDYFNLQTAREKSGSQLKLFTAQGENAQKELERLKAELEEIIEEDAKLLEEESRLDKEIHTLKEEIAQKEERLLTDEGDEESRRRAVSLLEEKLNQAKDNAFDLANYIADCRNRLRYQQQLLENNAAAKSRLKKQKEELTASLDELALEENRLKEALLEKTRAIKEKKKELEQINTEQNKCRDIISKLAQEETAGRYQAHSLSSRINMLEEMSQSGEGYYPGVRSILQGLKKGDSRLRGVLDVIARLIDVPEKYITAIETYLGASIQNIVAADEKSAKAAIAYLKEMQGGRATFLPLDTLKAREKGDFSRVLGQEGIFGRGSQLVECADKIRPAVEFLLNNLLVVEDMEAASKAARALNYRYSIVTLEGDMINPGASISGGSRNYKNNDLLGKRYQIINGRKELEALEKNLALLGEDLIKAREKAAFWDNKATEINSGLAESGRALQEMEGQAQQISLKKDLNGRQAGLNSQELSALKMQDNEILSQIEEINEELSLKEREYAGHNEETLIIQAELNKKLGTLDEGRADITRYKVDLAKAQQGLIALEDSLARVVKSRENLLWDKEEKNADLEEVQKELAKSSGLLKEEEENFALLGEKIIASRELLEEKRHGLGSENARLQEMEALCRAKAKEIANWQQQAHEQEIKKARLEAEWQNEEEKLKEKFQLTFEEAKAAWEDNGLSKTAMAGQLSQANREINALGAVNIGAIEEYAEVNKRHGFLKEQSQDLWDAKGSLEQVIGEMDSIMSSRFKSTFNKLSEEFNKAFVRLFNGGEAALVLTEPADILETGVELLVKLPGKKVSNYNLLSGGEKALCGIALMFAILAVRPTPFCVMDEVDSALDEANIQRFGEYLRQLSQNTQIVMISHRQGTMEIASSLWGITMEEEGVSKIISVRLNKESMVS